jgi:hypothetical protein
MKSFPRSFRKNLVLITGLSLLVTLLVWWFRPRLYRATATAVPASVYRNDRAGIFSREISALYPALGTAEDLDNALAVSRLGSLYVQLVEEFSLIPAWELDPSDPRSVSKAARKLAKRSEVIRSDFGALQVSVLDTDPARSADLSNALMDKINKLLSQRQNSYNREVLQAVRKEMHRLDSLPGKDSVSSEVLRQYRELELQYSLMDEMEPRALEMLEIAGKPAWPDQLPLWQWLLATGLLSSGLVMAYYLLLQNRNFPTDDSPLPS